MPKKAKNFCLATSIWLRTHIHEHRLVWRDMEKAFAAITTFFPTPSSYNVDVPLDVVETMAQLADNQRRAPRSSPYARSFKSNVMVSKDCWRDLDEMKKAQNDGCIPYNRSRNDAIRPNVAQLFESGLIYPAHITNSADTAGAKGGHQKEHTLYVDYRYSRSEWPSRTSSFTSVQDPYKVDLLHSARL